MNKSLRSKISLRCFSTKSFSHLDSNGDIKMVDVGEKIDTRRVATAKGYITMHPSTLDLIQSHKISKGNVLATAKIAGIMAAKQTSNLIPLCHPLQISKVDLEFSFDGKNPRINVSSTVKCVGKTGVEMEALISVSVACCTIYDMCKAVDKGMIISNIHVSEKQGFFKNLIM